MFTESPLLMILTPTRILVTICSSSREKENSDRFPRQTKKKITYRGTRIWLMADFSLHTLGARSQLENFLWTLRVKGFQLHILYPSKLMFDFEGKTKTLFDTEEFRKCISCVPFMIELLENIL